MKIQYLLLSLCGLLLFACNSTKPVINDDKKLPVEHYPENNLVLTYGYSDAPVGPEYFRSYEITINRERLLLTVSNAREIISTVEQKISAEVYDSLPAKIEEYQLEYDKTCKEIPSDGCSGGHSETVSYIVGKSGYLAKAYFCGGQRYGTSCGNLSAMGEYLRSFFSDFEKHLKRKE